MASLSDPSPKNNHHLKTFGRVNNYPVVNDSLLLVLSYYQWIKSKNHILDSSLTMIENTLKSVKDKTEPIVSRRLSFIDETMSNQLEKLERICPIILEPSPNISTIPAGFYSKAIQPSVNIMTWPMTKAIDVVTKTSSTTASTVSYIMEASMKFVIPSSLSTTHTVLDKSDQIIDKFLPYQKENDESICTDKDEIGVCTKVKRLSKKTQRRLYRMAVREIEILQMTSIAKLTKLRNLLKDIYGNNPSFKSRIVEGCESTVEPIVTSVPLLQKPQQLQETSSEIEQLQDIMTALYSVKKYATTNTLVSLHFINSNLSLLKTALIVNQKLLHHSIKIIEKIQVVIEYLMSKIKTYVKSQRTKVSKYGRKSSLSIFEELDSE